MTHIAPHVVRVDKGAMSLEIALIHDSFEAIAPRGEKFAETFYGLLFERYPLVKPMFANTSMAEQQKKVVLMLNVVVKNLDRPDVLAETLAKLGKGHLGYGVTPNHYRAFGECLLKALEKTLGTLWTPRLEQAWTEAYTTVSRLMQQGAADAEPVDPAPWLRAAKRVMREHSFPTHDEQSRLNGG